MWLEWRDGQITYIHDYRYVRYVTADAELTLAPKAKPARDGCSPSASALSWATPMRPMTPSPLRYQRRGTVAYAARSRPVLHPGRGGGGRPHEGHAQAWRGFCHANGRRRLFRE